jgi:hypothetical protein
MKAKAVRRSLQRRTGIGAYIRVRGLWPEVGPEVEKTGGRFT